ncbi:MAG: hypothetical protein KJO63_09015 [Maribacter sp.]|nr:hypothetical protein [Maribacter sp.]
MRTRNKSASRHLFEELTIMNYVKKFCVEPGSKVKLGKIDAGFKVPSEEEATHDFLWRYHQDITEGLKNFLFSAKRPN